MDTVQVGLAGVSMRLFCFVQAKLSVGMVVYVYLYWLHSCLCVWKLFLKGLLFCVHFHFLGKYTLHVFNII